MIVNDEEQLIRLAAIARHAARYADVETALLAGVGLAMGIAVEDPSAPLRILAQMDRNAAGALRERGGHDPRPGAMRTQRKYIDFVLRGETSLGAWG